MYHPEQKQMILKNSLGVSYHVYFEPGRGLCLRMLGDSRVWSGGFVLSDLSVNDFSAVLDRDDLIHFAFQSKDGRILYGHFHQGRMNIQPVLTSRDTTPWAKHISLCLCGNTLLILYVIRHKNQSLVSLQTIREGILSRPVAIDYVKGPHKNFLPLVDPSKKCHLFYIRSTESETVLNHRILKEDHSIFTAPKKLCVTTDDILFPAAASGQDNRNHLVFQIHRDAVYEVVYQQTGPSHTEKTLFSSPSPPGYTGLLYRDGTLVFFRVSQKRIFYRKSCDEGKAWSDEIPYEFGGIPECFHYRSNDRKETSDWFFTEVPGNFSKGYQLAFLQEDLNIFSPKNGFYRNDKPCEMDQKSKTPPSITGGLQFHALGGATPPSRAKISSDAERVRCIVPKQKEADRVNQRVGESEESHMASDLHKKVILLQNLTDSMKKELTKLWITQKEYEKKLEMLRQGYQRLSGSIQRLRGEADNKTPEDNGDQEETSLFTETGEIGHADNEETVMENKSSAF